MTESKSWATKKFAKENVSGTTSLSNNAIQKKEKINISDFSLLLMTNIA